MDSGTVGVLLRSTAAVDGGPPPITHLPTRSAGLQRRRHRRLLLCAVAPWTAALLQRTATATKGATAALLLLWKVSNTATTQTTCKRCNHERR